MSLKVLETFYSIQGEGPYAGQPAFFIRLAGCNKQCVFCDTEVNKNVRITYADKLVKEISPSNVKLVVLTGGEPLLQDIKELIRLLLAAGYTIQIESNGSTNPHNVTFPTSVMLVISPKGNVDPGLANVAGAFKFVIQSNEFPDLTLRTWAERNDVPVYIQPVYDAKSPGVTKQNQDWAVGVCLSNGYILSLQLHKILGVN